MNRRDFLKLFPAAATIPVAFKLGWTDLDEPDDIDVLPRFDETGFTLDWSAQRIETERLRGNLLLDYTLEGHVAQALIHWWPPKIAASRDATDRSIVGLTVVSDLGTTFEWRASPGHEIRHADDVYLEARPSGPDHVHVSLWRPRRQLDGPKMINA